MSRFLVSSAHSGRKPYHCWIMEAASADEIVARYPIFAEQPILTLPEERPRWINDGYWDALEAGSYQLTDPEPEWLTKLVDQLTNGPPWVWYFLKERPTDGESVDRGELGTFRRFEIGSDIGTHPVLDGLWRVAAIEPPPDPSCAATLVIEPAV